LRKTPGCSGRIHYKQMIYPIFIPHAGCPFQCVYCNQRAVVSDDSGKSDDIIGHVQSNLMIYANQVRRSGRSGEIAFFGGTFTALPPAVMESILGSAAFLVSDAIFTGIRFSTRPDCLEEGVVDLLLRYPVSTVELGAQSLSNSVLLRSGRGYRASSVRDASRLVKDAGWKLGIQLMAGLPGDDRELFIESMHKAIGIGPDFLRIYPTVVLEGTGLADSFKKGAYAALSIDEAIDWLAAAYDIALGAGVRVIRMGLHPDPALEKPGVILAGPHHPAFGYLVKCRWWRDRVDRYFGSLPEYFGNDILLHVAPSQVSEVIGHKRSNLAHWKARWGIGVKVVGRAGVEAGSFSLRLMPAPVEALRN